MARISSYALDAVPDLSDKVIGTDTRGNVAQRTKNYSLNEIIKLYNEKGMIGVADQVIFKWQSNLSEGREPGTISFELGGGNNKKMEDIADLIVSKKNSGDRIIDKFFELFNNKEIIIAEVNQINNFGVFILANLIDEYEPGFFKAQFVLKKTSGANMANGLINTDAHYIIGEFNIQGDKHFEFTQNTAVTTWNINHNLEKNPSVSITSFGGTVAEAKVNYIDKNNLTITFNAAFSGKAYLN
jgi:hypothetical protein